MELREYLRIVGKRIWILILCVVIITLATYLITKAQPIMYEGSFSTYVLVTESNNPISTKSDDQFFKYNDYYAWQTSSIFADNIISWFKDPAYISEIYQEAQKEIPVEELKKYSRLFTSKKNDPSTILINFSSKDKNEVLLLLNSAKDFVNTKTQDWLNRGLVKNISIDAGEPIVIAKKPTVILNTAVGLITGIIVGLALIFFTEYMRRK